MRILAQFPCDIEAILDEASPVTRTMVQPNDRSGAIQASSVASVERRRHCAHLHCGPDRSICFLQKPALAKQLSLPSGDMVLVNAGPALL